MLSTKLHDALSAMEKLIEVGQMNGSVNRVFDIIEMSSRYRPESSVLSLISYRAKEVVPTEVEWLTRLDELVDRYYKMETRPNIRIKVSPVFYANLNWFSTVLLRIPLRSS